MDITDRSPDGINAGIEHLIAGGLISYHGVVLYHDKLKRQPQLVVSSYSSSIHIENVQPEEAGEKIERSKQVLADLAERSATFKLSPGTSKPATYGRIKTSR